MGAAVVTFFLDRLSLSSFGLATAVKEFSGAVPDSRVVARRSDAQLAARMGLHVTGLWQALIDRRQIWHIDDMFAPYCIVVTLLGLLLRRQVVICPHGMLDRWAMRARRFSTKLKVLALIDAVAKFGQLRIHALNRQEARKASLLLRHARAVRVIPNSIPGDILEARESLIRLAPTGPRLVVGCLSRIARKKNQAAVVDLAIELRRTRPKVFAQTEFRIDGAIEDASYADEIHAAIRDARLEGSIRFGGAVAFEDRGTVLAGYDVFFFPSRSEGMPYVVLEVMAIGRLPIVSAAASCGFITDYGGCTYTSIKNAAAALPVDRAALATHNLDTARFIADYGPGPLRRFLSECARVPE